MKKIERIVKEFEENTFWKNVMLPAMDAAIKESMVRMVYCQSWEEIQRLQAAVVTIQTWMAFPRIKRKDADDDNEFEKSRGESADAELKE